MTNVKNQYNRKLHVIKALHVGTHLPDQGNYGKDLEKLLLGNTNDLIHYYISIIPKAENEIRYPVIIF